MQIRYVEVYKAINENRVFDRDREDHMQYIPGWEREALSSYSVYSLPPSAFEERPRVPPLDLPRADAGLVKREPEATLAAGKVYRCGCGFQFRRSWQC